MVPNISDFPNQFFETSTPAKLVVKIKITQLPFLKAPSMSVGFVIVAVKALG